MKSITREVKSAKIRIKVVNSTLELVGKKPFKSLFVEEICERSKISKVTFFKYFPQKEDVLLYYYRIWCLENTIKLTKRKIDGLEAVMSLYDQMAISYTKHPGLILSLVSYLTSLERPPAPFPLKLAERELLFPNEEGISNYELLSVPQMLEKFLLEAVFSGQIKSNSDTKELSHLFLSTLYGSIITCHLRQIDSLQVLYKRNLDFLIKGLNS